MTLGEFISKYRAEHNNMSMQEFADRSGISKGYISMLERGVNSRNESINPTIGAYRKIADFVGISVTDLLRSVDENSPVSLDPRLSDVGVNIVIAAGSEAAAKSVLRSLHISERDIPDMLYGNYNWEDGSLAQVADAIGCSLSELKTERTAAPKSDGLALTQEEEELVWNYRKAAPADQCAVNSILSKYRENPAQSGRSAG